MASITNIEFGLCSKNENGEERYALIPIDRSVQNILTDMLVTTKSKLDSHKGVQKVLEEYEPAQKYSDTEKLWISLDDENVIKIKTLYNTNNINTDASVLSNVDKLYFYFGIFHLSNGLKVVAFRRTAQFKGIVKAKSRLVKFIDDSLKSETDDIFKLDNDFDFIVTDQKIFILRPNAFAIIADLNEYILKNAADAIETISQSITFIGFDSIAKYVSKRIRAAKLIASLRSRDDLDQISPDLFKEACRQNNIKFEEKNGHMLPAKGYELGFLQALDRRRFWAELIQGQKEHYEAPNRRGIT